ncbi:MAG TPA: glutamate--tRNA ligase family protein [Vicinamibacterales bacterium]|jgi:glutamyl/glutaminyl-tRNA synthetase
MRDIISRFAPAPTGALHLGHIVNAVTVWAETRARGGRVLLRIEDHDRQRSRRQFETDLLEDLAWLGFEPDDPPVRQSDRNEIYVNALDRLRRRNLVYACRCSRSDIAQASQARDSDGQEPAALNADEPRYPGTCRHRGVIEGPGVGLRVRLEPSIERFVDLRLGAQEQRPAEQCGDLLVRDREGNWTYQFAAAVDDYVQGVTLVIRGTDLLSSTGRQIQLARMLGRTEPAEFLHHRLIMKTPRQKLSKSDRATGIRELRERGWTANRVIAHAMDLLRVSEGNCHESDG